MKILVTGGCGFIGSNFVDFMINKNYEVIVIDNESSPERSLFYKNSKANYYNNDIVDGNTEKLYKNVDYVFHFAARSRIQPCINSPLDAAKNNYLGTASVLEFSRINNVKKVIISSTSSIYGLKNKCPLKEEAPPDCLNPYSVSKYSAEQLCKLYSSLYMLDTVVLRYFNVYGERESDQGEYAPIIAKFFKQLRNKEKLSIVSDGFQRRDFTHVKDVVDANYLAMKYKHKLNGEVFNIGSGKNYSIIEIAKMISNNIQFIGDREGEARETLADISKAREYLGYNPKHSITEYIECLKMLI